MDSVLPLQINEVLTTFAIDAFHAIKNIWIVSSYAQIIWIMSSYAYFATPTCRQAAMQTYRVCKIAEDWRQQQSSALVKR